MIYLYVGIPIIIGLVIAICLIVKNLYESISNAFDFDAFNEESIKIT